MFIDKMAAGSSGGGVSEVENLLAHAIRAVQSINQSPKETNHPVDPMNMTASRPNPTSRPLGVNAEDPMNMNRPNPTSRPPGVNAELQRLFPHLYGTARRPGYTSGVASSSASARQSSRKRGSSALAKGKKTKLLSRKFFCLADKDQCELPTQQEKRQLFVHGLGEKKLSLPCDGSAVDLQHCLMEE